MLVAGAAVAVTAPSVAQAATLPAGFKESVAFSGLTNPTVVRFSPDGRIFVAEKSGLIKVFDSLLTRRPPSSPTSNVTSTTSGTADCSGWRSIPTSRPARTSTSSTPTTMSSVDRTRTPMGHPRGLLRPVPDTARYRP